MTTKILALQAENIKRLTVVQIEPDGNLVQITGPNGSGKTSVLDCIWWALEGTSHIQAEPIRKGAAKAHIRLDLGDLIVTRKFRSTPDKAKKFTTSVTVESKDGARFPQPQAVIDNLLGALSFDPLAFTRMSPRQQVDTLKGFADGVDFDALESAYKETYDNRTDTNRRAKQLRAQAEAIDVPADAPTEPVDDQALIDDLQAASQKNADRDRHIERGQSLQEAIENASISRQEALRDVDECKRHLQNAENVVVRCDETMASARQALTNHPEAPQHIDTTALRDRIDAARVQNEQIQFAQRRAGITSEAAELEDHSERMTKALESNLAERKRALADSKLPVEGIEFAEGQVLYQDLPFDQAMDADQLRISMLIAIAMNPDLRVGRIRDGSLLDSTSLALLAQMADEHDFQIWIERVDESGKVGFVLEDGHMKQ